VTQHVSPDRLAEVVRYVAQAHGEQTRKGSDIAYVCTCSRSRRS